MSKQDEGGAVEAETVRIYGASDDLIEVEGDVPGCDEYASDDAYFVVMRGDYATRLRVWFTGRGLWAIAAWPIEERIAMLPVTIRNAESGYSAEAEIENATRVLREAGPDA